MDLDPRGAPTREEREIARIQERNWFYESLSIGARERFLQALKDAESRGLDADAAWEEAVVAAETS